MNGGMPMDMVYHVYINGNVALNPKLTEFYSLPIFPFISLALARKYLPG
jgi:hypothetical protein